MQRIQPDLDGPEGSLGGLTVPRRFDPLAGPDEVAEVARILSRAGLVEAFGHVSVRVGEGFLITATTPLAAMDASGIHHIDAGGAPSPWSADVPLETPMHASIYGARPDVNAICRTHSPAAVIAGVRGVVPPVAHGLGGLSGEIRTCGRTDLVTDAEAGFEVASALGGAACVLIRGNGCVAVGESLGEAAVRARYLEERCHVANELGLDSATAFEADALEERSRHFATETTRAWAWMRRQYRDLEVT